jgi:hypothetical protein
MNMLQEIYKDYTIGLCCCKSGFLLKYDYWLLLVPLYSDIVLITFSEYSAMLTSGDFPRNGVF